MSKAFIIIAVVAYAQLSRTDAFILTISRDLLSTKPLEKNEWSYVEVQQTGGTENNIVETKIYIPVGLSFSDVYVFFANHSKEILQVNFTSPIKGNYYSAPYKAAKSMEGENAIITEDDNIYKITGRIPISWLPKNCSKISATVRSSVGRYYNYYGIQNFKISIPDLMVLEEFKSFNINQP